MELSEFKKKLRKGNITVMIVGLFVLAFGVFIAWLYFSGADKSSDIGVGGEIVLIILIIICVGVGGLMMYTTFKNGMLVRGGKHGIVKAINEGDKSYLVWIFENITNSNGTTLHAIWAYNSQGKQYNIRVKKNEVKKYIAFLSSHFPNAVLGYTDDMAEKMKRNTGVSV